MENRTAIAFTLLCWIGILIATMISKDITYLKIIAILSSSCIILGVASFLL